MTAIKDSGKYIEIIRLSADKERQKVIDRLMDLSFSKLVNRIAEATTRYRSGRDRKTARETLLEKRRVVAPVKAWVIFGTP